nr:VAN3-binding protein-like [Ipomoea batatas]
MDSLWAEKRFDGGGAGVQLPESPRLPMEFLSRSWSASALQICKALSPSTAPSSSLLPKLSAMGINNSGAAAPENAFYDEESAAKLFGNNTFCFASSATSQMVLERIMAQSMHNEHEISPLTSGRLSHSSGPLNSNGPLTEETDSPPISPHEEYEDVVKEPSNRHSENVRMLELPTEMTHSHRIGYPIKGGAKSLGLSFSIFNLALDLGDTDLG